MYIVLEIQVNGGVMAQVATVCYNKEDAEAKYHTVLAAAVKSGLDSHACSIINRDGSVEKHECYWTSGH